MKRILLCVEYDGTVYAGWQRQINGLAVQQVLEEALSQACGENVTVTGSSRTDAGVHALAQHVHFDTASSIPPEKFPFVLNNLLPPDIRVLTGREVPPDFHARFLSCGKTYTYRIWNARHASALYRNLCWHVPVPLDTAQIRSALPALIGTHDFSAFCAAGSSVLSNVRTVKDAGVFRRDELVVFHVEADGFLYNMVRIMAGTLLYIAEGKIPVGQIPAIIDSGDRTLAGKTMPPEGLYLNRVTYKEGKM